MKKAFFAAAVGAGLLIAFRRKKADGTVRPTSANTLASVAQAVFRVPSTGKRSQSDKVMHRYITYVALPVSYKNRDHNQHLMGIGGALLFLGALPHADELWRCYQAEQRGLAGRDTPECARELFA